MLARLISQNNKKMLLYPDGTIATVDAALFRKFLTEFKSIQSFTGTSFRRWQTGLTLENIDEYRKAILAYPGKDLAYVDMDFHLVIEDPAVFKGLLAFTEPDEYLSVPEYAGKHNVSSSEVTRLCNNNRITGAIYKADRWFIPINAEYPKDARKKAE